jgi:dipeptidase E
MKKLLLISNSTNPGEAYLGWPQDFIREFIRKYNIKTLAFIPFAGVTISWDDYYDRVAGVIEDFGVKLLAVHIADDPAAMIREADAVAVGGGNTFHLVYHLQKTGLMEIIRKESIAGKPYMGWSAGSNIACPSLKTTNDMPIIEPESFNCMGLIPFQINPHYLDAHPSGHGGETREQRIEEFLGANQDIFVAGLREACLLEVEGDKLQLKGRHSLRLFKHGQAAQELIPGTNLDYLLKK